MFQKIFEISDSGFCQNLLPKWSSERALNLEKEEPAHWPENALRVLNALRKPELAKIDFKFTGKEYSYEESIELLMGNLDALNELKVQYRLKIPLRYFSDRNFIAKYNSANTWTLISDLNGCSIGLITRFKIATTKLESNELSMTS